MTNMKNTASGKSARANEDGNSEDLYKVSFGPHKLAIYVCDLLNFLHTCQNDARNDLFHHQNKSRDERREGLGEVLVMTRLSIKVILLISLKAC